MPFVPISIHDTPGGPYLTYYVPKAGGTFPFTVHIVSDVGTPLDPAGVYAWSARPLQTFMDTTHRPTGHITGSGTAAADFIAFPNAGPTANTGLVDLMATSPFLDGAIGSSADPFPMNVYQFGIEAWVPPYGFDPTPSGWTPGDPPPAPWVDGDPAPDGWTPPEGYAPDACSYSIAPTDAAFDWHSHDSSFFLTASRDDCPSSPYSPQPWITVTPGAGHGTYRVYYAISENRGATRIGAIYVPGGYFAIVQTGKPSAFTPGPPPTGTYTPGAECSANYVAGSAPAVVVYTPGDDPCGEE